MLLYLFKFWDFSFCTAVYLINRLPTTSLKFEILYPVLFQKASRLQSSQILGVLAFPSSDFITLQQPSNIPQPTSKNPQSNSESIQPSLTVQTDQSNVDLSTPASHISQSSTNVPTEESQPSSHST